MAKKKTSSSPKGCTTPDDCDTKNTCIKGICTPDQGYTPDPVEYCDKKTDPTCICPKKGTGDCSRIPKGITPYCYADDDEHPNELQFCAYEQGGFLVAAEGCCTRTCPSEKCQPSESDAGPPDKDRPKGAPYKEKKEKKKDEPFPKLLKILLIIFAILLIAAGIFLSVSN